MYNVSASNAVGCALFGLCAYAISVSTLENTLEHHSSVHQGIREHAAQFSILASALSTIMPYCGELIGGTRGMITGYIGSATIMSMPYITHLAIQRMRLPFLN